MRSITDTQAFTILDTWFSQDMDKQRFFRAFCYAYVKKNIPYNAFKKTDYDYIYSLKRSADATPAPLAYVKFQQSHLPAVQYVNSEQDVNSEQEQYAHSEQDQDVNSEKDVNLEQEQEQDVNLEQEQDVNLEQVQDEVYQQLEDIIQTQNTIIRFLFMILFIVGLPIVTENVDIIYALLYPNRNCRPLLPY